MNDQTDQLPSLVRELLDILETVEVSDSGVPFHPTAIRTHTQKLWDLYGMHVS